MVVEELENHLLKEYIIVINNSDEPWMSLQDNVSAIDLDFNWLYCNKAAMRSPVDSFRRCALEIG